MPQNSHKTMSQTLFDTRQRADELLREAIAIWRQSNYSEHLEGLEKDPVFSILMSAVAWQANETDNEIARIKADVLEEYAKALVPYEAAHAVPATLTIEAKTAPEVSEVKIDHRMPFVLGEDGWKLMPIFKTRVLSMQVTDVHRIDGRRWVVNIVSDYIIRDLSLLCFTLQTAEYHHVTFRIEGKELSVIRPSQYSELPLTDPFLLDNALYSEQPYYNPASGILDLFALQNLRTYVVRPGSPESFFQSPANHFTLEVEFSGIPANFRFTPSMLHLNTILLANAYEEHTTLEAKSPISRIAGSGEGLSGGGQLMHLIRPAEEQIYANTRIRVRRVNADRFNQSGLVRLLGSMIDKLQSDYYAFQFLRQSQGTESLYHLRTCLQKLLSAAQQSDSSNVAGTYLIVEGLPAVNVEARYLMTNGSAVNSSIKSRARVLLPPGLEESSAVYIGDPVQGRDETDPRSATEMVRYHIVTADRIVTMADIRAFCFNQLMQTYSITRNMVTDIHIAPHLTEYVPHQSNACGYEIRVVITIAETPFVHRSFLDKIKQAEILLEKMMAVRSANIYPITVKIEVK